MGVCSPGYGRVTRSQWRISESQIDDRWRLYGIVRLRAMVAAVLDGAVSVGEVRFHDFLRSHGFVGWKGDRKILRRGRIVARADVLFDEFGVIIEFDGSVAHDEDTADGDAARDELLRGLGYVVEHVTWWQMYERPRGLVARIRAALVGRAPASGARGLNSGDFTTVRDSGDFPRPEQR